MPDSSANIDQERQLTERTLREKISRKIRLVKFEKTKQGNTVIHRQIDSPTRSFLAPQQANYEENLQMAPPLIQLEDIDTTSWKSQAFFTENSDENQQMPLALRSTGALSPIEEDESEAVETTNGIAFSLTKQGSRTKRRFIEEKDQISDILTIDDDQSSEKLTPNQDITSPSSPMPILPTPQPTIHEEGHVISYVI